MNTQPPARRPASPPCIPPRVLTPYTLMQCRNRHRSHAKVDSECLVGAFPSGFKPRGAQIARCPPPPPTHTHTHTHTHTRHTTRHTPPPPPTCLLQGQKRGHDGALENPRGLRPRPREEVALLRVVVLHHTQDAVDLVRVRHGHAVSTRGVGGRGGGGGGQRRLTNSLGPVKTEHSVRYGLAPSRCAPTCVWWKGRRRAGGAGDALPAHARTRCGR